MKKTMFIFLASPFLWFLSSRRTTAQTPVAQSDEITDDGSQQIIQGDSSPESIIS
jgi:hypothetical protein